MWIIEIWARNAAIMICDAGKGEYSDPVPVPLCPRQILRYLPWDWTQAITGRDRQPSAWATAQLILKHRWSNFERIWRSCITLLGFWTLTHVFWEERTFHKTVSVSSVTAQHRVGSAPDLMWAVFFFFSTEHENRPSVRNVLCATC